MKGAVGVGEIEREGNFCSSGMEQINSTRF